MDLKKIDKSTLKPGDIVGIPYDTRIGFRYFRYQKIIPEKIKRITPARTKFITESGTEYSKHDLFYVVDDESDRQTEVSKCAEAINSKLFDIEQTRKDCRLYNAPDENIIRISSLLDKVLKEIAGGENSK